MKYLLIALGILAVVALVMMAIGMATAPLMPDDYEEDWTDVVKTKQNDKQETTE